MDGTDYCFTLQDCSKDNKQKISDTKCDCISLFSIAYDNGKKYKHCYANNEYCGPEHSAYNSDTKECGNNCPSGWKKKIITRSGESYITRCSQNCLNSEYIDGDYCISDCPIGKFIYDNSGTKQCVDKCNDNVKFVLSDRHCSGSCDLYKYDNNSCLGSCSAPYYKTEKNDEKFCSLR
jgi:hypothetical protein